MNSCLPSQKRRFAGAWLESFDPARAARAVGAPDGVRLLSSPGVRKEIRLQRAQWEVSRQDALRRLAQLAFGRANDCVKLVLQETPDLDGLDLSLLSEVKRSEKGTVEVKLVDRLRALEQLLTAGDSENACAEAFFAACEEGEDP